MILYYEEMIGASFRLGLFLAVRQIRRSSLWSTLLIIFVMTLTFLNLVVVNGLLTGLPSGAALANETQYSGDVLISTPSDQRFIEHSQRLIEKARSLSAVEAISTRYVAGGTLEADYLTVRRDDELPKTVGAAIAGINPEDEAMVTSLKSLLVAGDYLTSNDDDAVMIGSGLLAEFSSVRGVPGFEALEGVSVGDKVRVTVGGVTQDVWVKGIIKAKIGDVQRRAFLTDKTLRKMLGRSGYEANEIAIAVTRTANSGVVRDVLSEGVDAERVYVQTALESQGAFLDDIKSTFSILGNVIGAIGLVVASVTVFILIFINALMRKKYIGILKGIGVFGSAIEISYVLQALFYATVGSGLGLVFLYGFIKPYFDANPLDFPFADGLLLAPLDAVSLRIGVLMLATLVAGYVPAKLIVRGNTLNAILGRT